MNKGMALVWHKHHVGQTPNPEQELPFEKEFQQDSRTSLCSQSPGSFLRLWVVDISESQNL